jgi:transketolase
MNERENGREKAIQTLKMLAVDAVEAAKSGHPGSPMGQAEIAYVIWTRFLRHWPADPAWPGRDRFVLSAGHGSMLLYGLLHLTGYDVPLEELKHFRQWGSLTPGHPERGHTPGVETTTGPLGQGFGNAVGLALAARMNAAKYGPSFQALGGQRVFGICSDGDVMEGVASEAASIAGHLGLGNLVLVYDDNHVTIEGHTEITFTEDVGKRFEAYGWHVERVDGHDVEQIERAIERALAEESRPSLIVARTHIAHGAPNAHDTPESHGAPLGAPEVKATKEAAGWPLEPTFLVPDDAKEHWRASAQRHQAAYDGWQEAFGAWRTKQPELAALWDAAHAGAPALPADLEARLVGAVGRDAKATREHGSKAIQEAAKIVPTLVGGSADLDPSTKTAIQGSGSIAPGAFDGRILHFGVREHGMGSILNGLALDGGFVPYGSTFLVFSDYMRGSMRLAALMGLRVVYVFTHDSLLLGEDGPTHQPVEHAWALRLIPNLRVWRPADGPETAIAWAAALRRADGPTAILLTRQKVEPLPYAASGGAPDAAAIARGGYVVAEASASANAGDAITLAATGSEVSLAVAAAAKLAASGVAARVVSIPCLEAFLAQDVAVRDAVVPRGGPLVTIELSRTGPWAELALASGVDAANWLAIGIDRFGASAPAGDLAKHFGFTPDAVAETVQKFVREAVR